MDRGRHEERLEDDLSGDAEMSRLHAGWLAMAATLVGEAPAAGQQAEPSASAAGEEWTVTVAPYLWATTLDGTASVAGTEADVDVPFSDLLKDLSGGAMLLVGVEKNRFGIGVNGLYARVSPDSDVGPIEIDATSDTAQLAIAPYYRLVEWQYGVSSSGRPLRLFVSPEAGLRFNYLRTELEIRGGPTVDGSESWVDPLIGSRIGLDLSDSWAIAGEANIGGFGVGSDFTWNVQAFIGYRTALFGRQTTFALGYRALSQDYDDGDFGWDVTMHGPIFGAALRF
jgi:hypothetical protein